jgi:molecular chaperone DnaK (HSP70)
MFFARGRAKLCISTLQYEYKDGTPSKWGFETEDDATEEKYRWFKLELDPKLKTVLQRRKYPKGTIQADDEDHVEKLITDYLTVLREHAQGRIRASFAGYENLLRGVPWEYIITVPAMWPEAAQDITRRCAENAGMAPKTPVHIISEPEAAGIYALEHMSHIGLSVGDTFVICDAGGG